MTTNPPLTPEQARALFQNLSRMSPEEKLEALELLDKSEDYKKRNVAKTDMIEFAKHVYPDRKSTRLNSSHIPLSRMPSSA